MKRLFPSLYLLFFLLFALNPVMAQNPVADKAFADLLGSIAANDYQAFLSSGTDQFKKQLPEQAFTAVASKLGPELKKGYETKYLDVLNQGPAKVYLWKISLKEGKGDILAKLAMIDGKVGGFLLQ